MKIIYIITAATKRNRIIGGHYYSLKAIADAMAKKHEVITIAVMHKHSEVVDTYKHRVEYVLKNGKTTRQLIDEIIGWITKEQPTVVHSFDMQAHLLAKEACAKTRTSLVETKPGGPKTRHTYPFSWDITLFTQDDLEHYSRHPILKKANLHYIPNRVTRPTKKTERLNEIPETESYFNIFTINRVNFSKLSIALQTLSMARHLRNNGIKARAVIIGRVEDSLALEKIKDSAHPDDLLLQEPPYIIHASELLPVADAVVAMGRGAMEALAYNKPVFCPSADGQFPFLLNNETFNDAMASNFSERSRVSLTLDRRKEHCLKITNDSDTYNTQCVLSSRLYKEFCDVAAVIEKYEKVYAYARTPPSLPFERQLMALASLLASVLH